MKKNILITGAAGFIGSHLAHYLAKSGEFAITALDDLSGGFEENLPEGVEFLEGSINDVALMDQLFEEKEFSYVYHLAAYAAEGLSHFIRRFNYENNLVGTVNLINNCIKYNVESFVFTSSIAVYGAGQTPMLEGMVPEPEDPYGVAKYAVEMDLKCAREMFGLNYVIFRPHNVYGEFQNIGDKYRNVVGIFMNKVLKGEALPVFGDGEQQRAFSYVGDIIPQMARSAWTPKAYGEVFNVGADLPFTVNELGRVIKEEMGVPDHPMEYLEARNEVKVAYSDHSKVREFLGEAPVTSLEDGISKMVKWVREHGARESPKFGAVEVEKNLPPSWLD